MRKINLSSLPLNFKFLNFSESIRVLRSIIAERKIDNPPRNHAEFTSVSKITYLLYCDAIINETTINALAGVGIPLKEVVCPGSLLNFARRSAEAAGRMPDSTTTGKRGISCPDKRKKIIAPGAVPKVTTSARLSSSFPISEYALSNRAENPSAKSKAIPAIMRKQASVI